MKAVILAGGLGTRLRPLTYNTPKSLVPVLNRPFLEHVLLWLKKHGVDEAILALSHLAPPVEDCFGDGSRLGIKISYVLEKSALGTAGAVKNAAELVVGSFFVLNGDIFSDLDFSAMLAFHRQNQARATIALTPVDNPTHYGLIETDSRSRVTRFLEKPRPEEVTTNMINAGTYVLEPGVLDMIPPSQEYSFERQLFPSMLAGGDAVYAFPSSGYWIDIGNPEKYRQLNFDLLSGKGGQYGFNHGHEIITGRGCRIHPTAILKGPLLVGDNCSIGKEAVIIGPTVIGSGCLIEDAATISASVIWQNVTIGNGSRFMSSIAANGCHLQAGSEAIRAVLGDNVTISRGYKLEPGARVEPGKTIG
ncbi:MAG: NDP-sugar synthase [Dehalococcoidia bacterium]|nr:MAG: NDP-sugar synthase [Dehalococcoidia bacterium]